MREKLVSRVCCQDGEFLWCYDDAAGALTRINIETLEIECMLSPMQLIMESDDEIGNLISWKDKIILLPSKIGKKWVFYNKREKQVEYKVLCMEHHKSAAAILNGDKLIVIPIFINDPIIVIDLIKEKAIKRVFLSKPKGLHEVGMGIYNAKEEQGDICFLIENSCFFGRIRDDQARLIKIDVKETLLCADFCEGIGWAVDRNGKLYKFDREGEILETHSLYSNTMYTRIAVYSDKIFMLPVGESQIEVFNIEKKDMIKIEMQQRKEPVGVWEVFQYPDYWKCVKVNTFIWLMPLKYPLLIINLATLECKQRELEYTNDFSKDKYREYHAYVRKMRKTLFYENSFNESLERFLKVVNTGDYLTREKEEIVYGRYTWKAIQ